MVFNTLYAHTCRTHGTINQSQIHSKIYRPTLCIDQIFIMRLKCLMAFYILLVFPLVFYRHALPLIFFFMIYVVLNRLLSKSSSSSFYLFNRKLIWIFNRNPFNFDKFIYTFSIIYLRFNQKSINDSRQSNEI